MKKSALPFLVASAIPLVAGQAHGAGFALPEQGVSGLGNAYAGAAAAAEDASTLWWNPAGMARLASGKHLAFALHAIVPSSKFSDKGSTPAALSDPSKVGNGGDAGNSAFIPNLFFAMDLNPAWSFGVGVSVPFGLKTEYQADWIGRFQGVSSEVKTININPAVSYKLGGGTSVGFGVSYQSGEIDLKSAVNYSGLAGGALPAGLEGVNATSLEGDAWGFNVGVLFDLTPATRLGVHYRSSLDYSLKGSTSFTNVPGPLAANPLIANGDVKADLETPATVAVSVVHKASGDLELLADVTWTEWSKVSQVPLIRTSGALSGSMLDTLVFNFEDVWRVSVGANYRYRGPWTLKAGFAYDQAPVPNAESRTVRLPDNDRYWLSLGATYRMSAASRLDLGYTYVMIKDADINNDQSARGRGIVRGTYQASSHIFGVQYQHSF